MTPSPSYGLPLTLLLVLGFLTVFTPASIDMYLPAMPAMARSLEASEAQVQATLSVFLLGFALGPLIAGPLSDRFGRRPVLLTGGVLFVITSLLCASAGSAEEMMAWRLLQAASGGTVTVLARAVVGDLLSGDEAARIFSILMLILSIAPMVAPALGSELLLYFDWRAIFLFLAGMGVIGSLLIWGLLRETLPPERRRPVVPAAVLRGYVEVLTDPRGAGYLIVSSGASAAFFAALSATPFVFIDYYGMSERLFAIQFGAAAVLAMATNTVCIRIVRRVGFLSLVRWSSWALIAVGLLAFLQTATGIGGLWALVACVIWLMGAMQICNANAMAGVMQLFSDRAGAASAAFSACRLLAGMATTLSLGLLYDGTPWSFGLVLAIVALIMPVGLYLLRREAPPAADRG